VSPNALKYCQTLLKYTSIYSNEKNMLDLWFCCSW